MPRLGLALRYLALLALLSVLPAIPLVAFASASIPRTLWIALGIGALELALLALTPEQVLERTLGARAAQAMPATRFARQGLGRTVEQTFREKVRYPAPKVSLFLDPYPIAVFCRRWGGHGRIFLSVGALNALSEEQLRALLLRSVARCREAGCPLRSACAILSLILSSLLSPKARARRGLTPNAWIRLTMESEALAGLRIIGGGANDGDGEDPRILVDALQKLERPPLPLAALEVR